MWTPDRTKHRSSSGLGGRLGLTGLLQMAVESEWTGGKLADCRRAVRRRSVCASVLDWRKIKG
jgi:hypothetical protein